MKTVFADSFYYFSLMSKSDGNHSRAVEFSRKYRGNVVTTEWILTEIADGLAEPRKRHGFVALRDGLLIDETVLIVPATTDNDQESAPIQFGDRDKLGLANSLGLRQSDQSKTSCDEGVVFTHAAAGILPGTVGVLVADEVIADLGGGGSAGFGREIGERFGQGI